MLNYPNPSGCWVLTFVHKATTTLQTTREPSAYFTQRSTHPKHSVEHDTLLVALSDLLTEHHYKVTRVEVLEPSVAYDIFFHTTKKSIPFIPKVRAGFEKILAAKAIDYLLQVDDPTQRRKKLLICDMDGTLIANETLNDLAILLGLGSTVTEITHLAMDGKIDFETALRRRVRLLKGHSAQVIERVIANIRLTPDVQLFIKTLRTQGVLTILASGGFKPVTTHIKMLLGFEREVANTFEIVADKFTGEILPPFSFRETKAETLREVMAERGLHSEQTLAVGDGANDLAMLHAAGLGVLFHPSKSLLEQVTKELTDTMFQRFSMVRYNSFKAVLYFQGYREADFVKEI